MRAGDRTRTRVAQACERAAPRFKRAAPRAERAARRGVSGVRKNLAKFGAERRRSPSRGMSDATRSEGAEGGAAAAGAAARGVPWLERTSERLPRTGHPTNELQ